MTQDNTEYRINEELRQKLIDEYVTDKSETRKRDDKKTEIKSFFIIFIAFCICAIPMAVRPLKDGDIRNSALAFSIIIWIVIILLLISALVVVIVTRSSQRKYAVDLRETLEHTTYRIEDGYLLREYKGNRRRNRKFDLGRIYAVQKEGHIVSFDFKSETVEFLDFYEPPMFDAVKAAERNNKNK